MQNPGPCVRVVSGSLKILDSQTSTSFMFFSRSLRSEFNHSQANFSPLPLPLTIPIKILSTWGDQYYVGLTALEVNG